MELYFCIENKKEMTYVRAFKRNQYRVETLYSGYYKYQIAKFISNKKVKEVFSIMHLCEEDGWKIVEYITSDVNKLDDVFI